MALPVIGHRPIAVSAALGSPGHLLNGVVAVAVGRMPVQFPRQVCACHQLASRGQGFVKGSRDAMPLFRDHGGDPQQPGQALFADRFRPHAVGQFGNEVGGLPVAGQYGKRLVPTTGIRHDNEQFETGMQDRPALSIHHVVHGCNL